MSVTPQELIDQTRILSGLRNNQLFTDADILVLLNDAQQELDDQLTQANQFYRITFLDFTLAGGVGGNTRALPSDFVQDKEMEQNPDTDTPRPVHYLPSWSDRNSVTWPHYFLAGSTLTIFPARNSAGNYRLWYVPQLPDLVLRTIAVQASDILLEVSGRTRVSLAAGEFTTADEGRQITLAFAAPNTAYNGDFIIDEVISETTAYLVDGPNPAGFSSPASGSATVQSLVPDYLQTWTMYLKLHASIAIRQSRQKTTSDLDPKFQRQLARIASMTSNRQTGPLQPPLTRDRSDFWFGDD